MRAITQIPISIAYQSYFDSVAHERAILSQPGNQMIVPSTVKESRGGGYAVGLAGFSDCPIAIRFFGSKNDSGEVILRPGQIIRPGPFEAFNYGLPFGWLGGGKGVLYVANTKDADLDLGAPRQEMIFHRSRYQIIASVTPLPAVVKNWPLQFPWTQAFNSTGGDQRGSSVLRVHPTRVLVRLRLQLAVAVSIGVIFRSSRDLDEGSAGAYAGTDLDSTFCEVAFQPSTDPQFVPYPTSRMPDDFAQLACDEGGITLVNLGSANVAAGSEVDIVRYGRLG